MILSVELKNFGPIHHLHWSQLGPINLVIGPNDSGKTFLLKALYTAIRAVEEFQRGNEPRELLDILGEKLYWTFEPDKIGDLVTRGKNEPLECRFDLDEGWLTYRFGRDTTRQIQGQHQIRPRPENSIFLPAKEVLSGHRIILNSREQDKSFGFDETYVELARALERSPTKGKNYGEFAEARRNLEEMLGGKVEFDEEDRQWHFTKGRARFPIGATAEGVKKIAILDTLLGNRYLSPHSIVFVDEPEAALHPAAIIKFLDIVAKLAERGMQFFLASHSYFVIKKLYLIAREHRKSIPILAAENSSWQLADLRDGMPENSIVAESIRLYEEEIDGVLGS